MFVRKGSLITALLSVLLSITPGWVQAAENKLTITSYHTFGMGFVGRGHCQWWSGSPLYDQNPHVWLGFFIALVAAAIIIFRKYLRNKKLSLASDEEADKLPGLLTELVAKENRLKNKIFDLDEKFTKGQIGQPKYDGLCHELKKQLAHVRVKIDEIKKMD